MVSSAPAACSAVRPDMHTHHGVYGCAYVQCGRADEP
uniref:Uncharacterized protein n=1 Tax=Arundo donax TaxID=35708 RepID=A0A0A9BSH6_ARUDO